MEQLKGMMRDMWWLWLGFILFVTVLAFTFHFAFFLMYPVLGVMCLYFAMMRYDENGNEKSDF